MSEKLLTCSFIIAVTQIVLSRRVREGKKKRGGWKALIHDRTARTRLVVSYNAIYKSYGDTYTRIYWPCYFSIGLERPAGPELTYWYESRIRSSRDYFSNLYPFDVPSNTGDYCSCRCAFFFFFFFFLKIDRLTARDRTDSISDSNWCLINTRVKRFCQVIDKNWIYVWSYRFYNWLLPDTNM